MMVTRMYSTSNARSRSFQGLVALFSVSALLAGCGDTGGGSGGSDSDEKFTLKLHEYQAPNHPFYTAGVTPFKEYVEEESEGRITVELYDSSTLGTAEEQFTIARAGTADIVDTAFDYVPDQLPIAGAANTYSATSGKAVENAEAIWNLCHQEPFLTEIKEQGVLPIGCTAIPAYEVFSSKEMSDIPEDLAGLRVRGAGGLQDDFLRALGMEAISMPSPELYQALERGTIDGASFLWYALPPHSIHEQVSYGTDGIGVIPTGGVVYGINTEVWESMPADLQEIVYDAGQQMSYDIGVALDEATVAAREEIGDAVQVIEVADEDREEAAEMTASVLENWVSRMEDLGKGEQARQALDAVETLEGSGLDGTATVDEWEDFELTGD